MSSWPIFKGDNKTSNEIASLPEPPPWRRFDGPRTRGVTFQASDDEIRAIAVWLAMQ